MINFNELLAKDLAEYLYRNEEWFMDKSQEGFLYGLNQQALQEAIEGFFKHGTTAALLRSK